MTKYLLISLYCLAACGAQDDSKEEPRLPDGYVRMDVMPGDDLILKDEDGDGFYDIDEPSQDIDKWKSAEYYGLTVDGTKSLPCFNSEPLTRCYFPVNLTFKVHKDTTNCFDGSNLGIQQEKVNIFSGFLDGMKFWNNHDRVTVTDTTAGGAMGLLLKCEESDPGTLAFNFFSVGSHIHRQVPDLPNAPSGNQAGAAWQYDETNITIADQSLYTEIVLSCHFTGIDANNAAWTVGMHEMGHAVGFGHVTTGFMKPHLSCDELRTGAGFIPSSYSTALSHYNGSASGAQIVDDGLPKRQ